MYDKREDMRIEIVDYDSGWPDLFRQTAQPIRAAMGDIAVRIDHIGSTSVPGAAAKPVIDIQISVRSFEPFESLHAPLESLGYVWRADNDDKTKRFFREPPGTRRTHIHVRELGGWSEQQALLFRDYLRTHPDDIAAYATLKRRLAGEFADNREAYTEAKGPFIWQVMMRANTWTQVTGWRPAESDV